MISCPKCGSSDYCILFSSRIIVPKIGTKNHKNRLQCDDCGFEWKWME